MQHNDIRNPTQRRSLPAKRVRQSNLDSFIEEMKTSDAQVTKVKEMEKRATVT